MSRLSRFLHLERARAGRPGEADPRPGTAERFEGVERPGPGPAAPRSSGADLDRFGPEPPPSIEILETPAGAQPFVRCMRCGMDHAVFARRCTSCGADLDTAAQRAFNDRLWEGRREEARREDLAAAERRARGERDQRELEAARRAMGEALAREVAARERFRLGAGRGWWGGEASGLAGPPLGLRLLGALPELRWKVAAILAALALLGGLTALGLRGHPLALLAAVVLGVVLVVPRWRVDRF